VSKRESGRSKIRIGGVEARRRKVGGGVWGHTGGEEGHKAKAMNELDYTTLSVTGGGGGERDTAPRTQLESETLPLSKLTMVQSYISRKEMPTSKAE